MVEVLGIDAGSDEDGKLVRGLGGFATQFCVSIIVI